jgi:hypothetical protein
MKPTIQIDHLGQARAVGVGHQPAGVGLATSQLPLLVDPLPLILVSDLLLAVRSCFLLLLPL